MLLSDREIRAFCTTPGRPVMIEPFSEAVSGGGIVSFGLSHCGYDLRLAPEVWGFREPAVSAWDNPSGDMVAVDPRLFMDDHYREVILRRLMVYSEKDGTDRYVVLPPHSYVLAASLEYLRIPRHLKGRCTGKSTLARCGLIVNTTPAEPGWEGHLTLELGNVTPRPLVLRIGEGIAQLEFETLSMDPEQSYADKHGIYQRQTGVTTARVRE